MGGHLTVYSSLEGIVMCRFSGILEKDNRQCRWKMPIVTLVFQQGMQNGIDDMKNVLQISAKNKILDK